MSRMGPFGWTAESMNGGSPTRMDETRPSGRRYMTKEESLRYCLKVEKEEWERLQREALKKKK